MPIDFNPLFTGVNQYDKTVSKGSVVAFQYLYSMAIDRPNVIHDPYPMVIVTDIWSKYLRGINLHYLTFPFIKTLLSSYCDNKGFGYYNIKGNNYIAGAFRMYILSGMSRIKKLNCDILIRAITELKSQDEYEVEAMRKQIEEMVQKQVQPRPPQPTFAIQPQPLGIPATSAQQIGE